MRLPSWRQYVYIYFPLERSIFFHIFSALQKSICILDLLIKSCGFFCCDRSSYVNRSANSSSLFRVGHGRKWSSAFLEVGECLSDQMPVTDLEESVYWKCSCFDGSGFFFHWMSTRRASVTEFEVTQFISKRSFCFASIFAIWLYIMKGKLIQHF